MRISSILCNFDWVFRALAHSRMYYPNSPTLMELSLILNFVWKITFSIIDSFIWFSNQKYAIFNRCFDIFLHFLQIGCNSWLMTRFFFYFLKRFPLPNNFYSQFLNLAVAVGIINFFFLKLTFPAFKYRSMLWEFALFVFYIFTNHRRTSIKSIEYLIFAS